MTDGGFAVDVPVTNLDESDDDQFHIDEDYLPSPSADLESIDIPRTNLSLAQRIKHTLTNIFSKTDTDNRFKYLDNIELFDTNHIGSSDSLDDELAGFDTEHSHHRKRLLHRSIFGICAVLFIGLLLATAAWASRSNLVGNAGTKGSKKPIYSNGTTSFYPTTLIISLDGFHPHYISKELTPFLDRLVRRENSYYTPYMLPTDPSVTFTNHYTLVTGLKPIYHGIVSNRFYDPKEGERFVNTNNSVALDPKWWGGEPVWQTAERQGVSSAIHMWPGSEVKFPNNFNPMYVDKFNGTEILSRKIDRIFQWIDLPIEKRPELIMSYVPNIDSVGHKYGIAGEHLKKELKKVDKYIEDIYTHLSSRNLEEIVNVIILSDHGMAPASNSRLIYLDDLVGEYFSQIEQVDGWPLYGLRPYQESDVDKMFREMRKNYHKDPNRNHYNIYLRDEIIDELFGGSDSPYISRIAPIWVLPKVGYSIVTRQDMKDNGGNYTPIGVHGYNSTEVLMRALFVATGPFFEKRLGKQNTRLQPFKNLEVYNIICDSLNLEPSGNNGTYTSGKSIIQANGLLDDDWEDDRLYPDVSFPTELMDVESTYDNIFYHGGLAAQKGNLDVTESEISPKVEETETSEKEEITKHPEATTQDVVKTKTIEMEPTTVPSKISATPTSSNQPEHKGHTLWDNLVDIADDVVDSLKSGFDAITHKVPPSES